MYVLILKCFKFNANKEDFLTYRDYFLSKLRRDKDLGVTKGLRKVNLNTETSRYEKKRTRKFYSDCADAHAPQAMVLKTV